MGEDAEFMGLALDEARRAAAEGEVPSARVAGSRGPGLARKAAQHQGGALLDNRGWGGAHSDYRQGRRRQDMMKSPIVLTVPLALVVSLALASAAAAMEPAHASAGGGP